MTLYEKIYNQLKSQIIGGEFDFDRPLPTELELQKKYNVSRITVKQAYSKLTEEGIVERIAGKGTFISKNYKRKGAPLIGLILCDFDSTFGERLIKGIEETATEYGYGIVLKRSLNDHVTEEKAINHLLELNVSGIIIQNCHGDFTKNLIGLTFNGFPAVSVDRYAKGLLIPSVTSDNYNGCILATEYLIKAGHRKILFASAKPENASTLTERADGFKQAHIQNGVALSPDNFITDLKNTTENAETDIEDNITQLEKILADKDVTAIVASEHFVAELCSIAAKRINKSFPKDIELICFDCDERILSERKYSYIRQNERELGRIAVERLIAQINGEEVAMRTIVKSELVLGNSTNYM